MKALVLGLVFVVGLGTAMAAKPAKRDVVLIGTIVSIDEMREEFAVDHLGITVSVDKVVSGELTESKIRFVLPVHGDSWHWLQVGGSYEIQAKRTRYGYEVGETGVRTIKTAPGAKPSKDLLLVVTVTAIKDTDELQKAWRVSTKVEKVLAGELSGRTFRFAMTSPQQAGLKVGKKYTIPAHWTGHDYEVNELEIANHNH